MATEQNQKSLPRYMGIPIFMRTPYHQEPEGIEIALIGVPYDGGSNQQAWRPSRTTRNTQPVEPHALCKIADIGDVTFEGVFDHDAVVRDIESFFARVHAAGVIPLSARNRDAGNRRHYNHRGACPVAGLT